MNEYQSGKCGNCGHDDPHAFALQVTRRHGENPWLVQACGQCEPPRLPCLAIQKIAAGLREDLASARETLFIHAAAIEKMVPGAELMGKLLHKIAEIDAQCPGANLGAVCLEVARYLVTALVSKNIREERSKP